MNKKFAKLFENDRGEILLLHVKEFKSEGFNRYGVELNFDKDERFTTVKLEKMTLKQSYDYVEEFTQENANNLLNEPLNYFLN